MIDTACVRVCVEVNYIRYIYVNLHPQTAFNADNIYAYVHCVRHAAGCVYLFSSAYAEYSFFSSDARAHPFFHSQIVFRHVLYPLFACITSTVKIHAE